MNIVLVLVKRGTQNFKTLLQYLHCEEHFISGYNKFDYNFPTNPPAQIAKECVYILMDMFKSFLWVAGSELKASVMYLCALRKIIVLKWFFKRLCGSSKRHVQLKNLFDK